MTRDAMRPRCASARSLPHGTIFTRPMARRNLGASSHGSPTVREVRALISLRREAGRVGHPGAVEKAHELAGLEPKLGRGWHWLRQKFASALMTQPLEVLCELGGWKTAQTVLQCYQRVDRRTAPAGPREPPDSPRLREFSGNQIEEIGPPISISSTEPTGFEPVTSYLQSAPSTESVTATNRINSCRTARSVALADRRHLIPPYRYSGKTTPNGGYVGLRAVHGLCPLDSGLPSKSRHPESASSILIRTEDAARRDRSSGETR